MELSAYDLGFVEKCAELGIDDPELLEGLYKEALDLSQISGFMQENPWLLPALLGGGGMLGGSLLGGSPLTGLLGGLPLGLLGMFLQNQYFNPSGGGAAAPAPEETTAPTPTPTPTALSPEEVYNQTLAQNQIHQLQNDPRAALAMTMRNLPAAMGGEQAAKSLMSDNWMLQQPQTTTDVTTGQTIPTPFTTNVPTDVFKQLSQQHQIVDPLTGQALSGQVSPDIMQRAMPSWLLQQERNSGIAPGQGLQNLMQTDIAQATPEQFRRATLADLPKSGIQPDETTRNYLLDIIQNEKVNPNIRQSAAAFLAPTLQTTLGGYNEAEALARQEYENYMSMDPGALVGHAKSLSVPPSPALTRALGQREYISGPEGGQFYKKWQNTYGTADENKGIQTQLFNYYAHSPEGRTGPAPAQYSNYAQNIPNFSAQQKAYQYAQKAFPGFQTKPTKIPSTQELQNREKANLSRIRRQT